MEHEELDMNRRIYASENNIDINKSIPIQKSDLEIGKTYKGVCRNSDTAVWDGKVFWYDRYKFGSVFKEDINHYEDDNGYDVFIPFELL